jgi:hypothetical protein
MKKRPGLVLYSDEKTPKVLIWHGENFYLEKLPSGSKIIYPPEPLKGLKDLRSQIKYALENPLGDSKPLKDYLFAEMKLTIAFDDISLPLPPMRQPDIRQLVIEEILNLAAEKGVDDVVLIAALALHRRMTQLELRHILGDRIFEAFYPYGLLLQHNAEDQKELLHIGFTEQNEDVEINKRAAESDLLIYVNINLVAMDGGHKSVATGLSSYRSLKHHHNVEAMLNSRSFMDMHHSELHSSNWRMGKVIKNSGIKVFQIETTLNNATFPHEFAFLQKREWEWDFKDRLSYYGVKKALDNSPRALTREVFHKIKSPYQVTSIQAGEVEEVHHKTLENVFAQQKVEVEGQSDILLMGLPYICPYNVNSIMNPILVACLGLGYFFNMYLNKPLVRKGGVAIISHPTTYEFNQTHHPSYIDFFEQVLTCSTDPLYIQQNFEESFAYDPWYSHLYQNGYAYHGVHPFYMWYWCAHALDHLSSVIIIGGNKKAVKRMGFKSATTLSDALEIAEDYVGKDASLTYLHVPPLLIADVK